MNLFSYCGNNPVNRTDPTGHLWKEIGQFFSNAWNTVKTWAKNTFGAGASIVNERNNYTPNFSELLPITVRWGSRTETTSQTSGNIDKPVSVYAEGRSDNWVLSSVGIELNYRALTLSGSWGVDDFGIGVSVVRGNSSRTLKWHTDLSKFQHGIEYEWTTSSPSVQGSNVELSNYVTLGSNGMSAFFGTKRYRLAR